MPIPYRQRKEYFRQYYQRNKGVKSVKKGVKVNTQTQPQKLTPNLTPQNCSNCQELKNELATIKQFYENLRQQLESEKEQKREYWRQQKKHQRAKVSEKQK